MKTMTVGELILKLGEYQKDAKVYLEAGVVVQDLGEHRAVKSCLDMALSAGPGFVALCGWSHITDGSGEFGLFDQQDGDEPIPGWMIHDAKREVTAAE